MQLQLSETLAEQTIRNLHEDLQNAEAVALERVKELQLEAHRLISEKEQ
jgi:hypothetical protein